MKGRPTDIVALLRGINLGRNKRISMAALRELLAELGYERVRTHLQSGNAIFTAAGDPATVARAIERAIADKLGFEVGVIMRTAPELAGVVAANPLAGVATDPSRHHVMFLPAEPDADALKSVREQNLAPEAIAARGRELYLWCPAGSQSSNLMKAVGRAGIARTGTARNWNTVTKLLELVGD